MSYLVHLRQFEGPLGLLLYLIRKEEMDIFDIKITEITKQYLDYIRMMKELDLELAGEFVAMAATLIHIKSRMLLPSYNEEGEVVEQEDPRKELVQKLLDYQRYQDVSKRLYGRPLLGRDVFARGIREEYLSEAGGGEVIVEEDGLFSLISSYRMVIRKALRMVHKVRPKVLSIAERVMQMKHRLLVGVRVVLSELIDATGESRRGQVLVTFLSLLELGRMGYVSLFQSDTYGDIHIEAVKPIERNVLERVQEFDAGDIDAIANSLISEAIEEREDKIDLSQIMASDDSRDIEQLDLAVTSKTTVAEAVDAGAADIDSSIDKVIDVASDEDILAAEAELGDV